VVQTDAITVSNAPTIALADTDGVTCSDPTQILPPSLSKSGLKVMFLGLQDAVSNSASNGTNATTYSYARVLFYEFDRALPVSTTQGALGVSPSLDNCYTENNFNGAGDDGLSVSALNVGTSITLTSSSGNVIALTGGSGVFFWTGSSNPLPSGTWGFSNGVGGSDIGPRSFTFTVPQQVVWTNQAAVSGSPIDRASPLKITWTGGDSNGYVHILGFAGEAAFECAAPTSPGEFTIPPSILLGLPAGTQSSIQVSTRTIPLSFGAVPGIDLVEDISTFATSVSVVFK
jgi:hypothetical protein